MDRYSTIRGTVASGAEMQLGESAGLTEFLKRLGILDTYSILQAVEKQICGFVRLAGYETEMQNQKPVAVRYAPMHKLNGVALAHPFCALAVNGVENRWDRESKYFQTFLFSHQQMRKGKDGYNYLDMLFGNELLSWKTLELYREGKVPLDCDPPLRKVTPKIEANDLRTVLKTVEAIYSGKNVVIRLEPNYSFNDRAMSLLAGIYSLIPPVLATEVGYATYQRPLDIAEIVERNSIRIFVLPAGESLDQIPDTFLKLDLAEPSIRLEKTPLMEALANWIQIPWEQRQSAMQQLFETEKYGNVELFIQLFLQKSEAFFQDLAAAEKWNRDPSQNGTLFSMEALYTEYENRSSSNIPWFEQMFREKIGKLIGKRTTLEKLNAQTAVELFTSTGEEQQKARKLYLFGHKFGNVDVGELCQLVSAHQKRTDDQAHSVEVAALGAKLEKTKEEAVTALRQARLEADAALEAEKKKTQQAIDEGQDALNAAKAKATEALAEEQKKSAAALTTEKERTQKAITDGQAALDAAQARAAEALAREREASRIAIEAEKANTRKAVEDGESAVLVEKNKTAAVQQEKESLHAKALTALTEEKKHTQDALALLEQEKQQHRQALENAQGLEDQANALQQNLRQERKNVEELNLILDKTKQERADAIGRISDAESKVSRAEADRRRMETERDAALQAQADAQKKLDNYKHGKYNKKLIAIGGLAGLLAGALAVGAIWLCTSLTRKPAPVPPAETVTETMATEPAETTQETTAPTLETQIPTVETLPQNTDYRIGIEDISLLQTYVPALGVVKTENLEFWIPETLPLEPGDVVLALLTTEEILPEEPLTSEFPCAFLIAHSTLAQEADERLESPTEAAKETSSVPAALKISAGRYDLVVYGDETMQDAAMDAVHFLIPEEIEMTFEWSSSGLESSEQNFDTQEGNP